MMNGQDDTGGGEPWIRLDVEGTGAGECSKVRDVRRLTSSFVLVWVLGCNDAPSGDGTTTDGGTAAETGTSETGMSTSSTGSSSSESTTEQATSSTSEEPVVLEALEVTPIESVARVDLNTPTTWDFVVTGSYSDGSSADLTAQAAWSHSNPMLGAMDGATLEVPGFAVRFAGSTVVSAEVDGLVGEAQLTVAAHALYGEDAELLVVLPYGAPEVQAPLTFTPEVRSLDVFFNVDTTGSMGGPIGDLQSTLVGTVIPGIEAAVPDTHFGVGAFEDFPISPFGANPCATTDDPDQPFELLMPITGNVADVQLGVSGLTLGESPIGCGDDHPESTIEALYQIATGEGLGFPAPTFVASNTNGVGGVEFRAESLPLVVTVTDAWSHDPGNPLCTIETGYDDDRSVFAVAHTRQEAELALVEICARAMTVAVGDFDPVCSGYADGVSFAEATGTVVLPAAWDLAPGGRPPGCAAGECCTGIDGAGVPPDPSGSCPLVYRAPFGGVGLGASAADGVFLSARYGAIDVTSVIDGVTEDIDGVPLPMPITTADFISTVTPLDHGPSPLSGATPPVLTPTAFQSVIPGTSLTFAVSAENDLVPQTDAPRLFTAEIRIRGDGCYDVGAKTVLLLVPPAPLER
jgi:hypothetical protein